MFTLSIITKAKSEVGENTELEKKNAKINAMTKIEIQIYHFIWSIGLNNDTRRLINSKNNNPPPKMKIIDNNKGDEVWKNTKIKIQITINDKIRNK